MKIWVIGRGYPTTENKMWGSFELEQAKLLARNGHEVSYIALTLSFFNRKDKRGIRSFGDEGVNVFVYSHLYFPGKAGIYLEKFEDSCWRKLLAQAEQNTGRPDIIHVHYPSMISSINEIEAYRRQGVQIFATEHWSRVLIDNLKGFEYKRLQYYAANSSCFISVSKPLEESVRKLVQVSAPMSVVPNIISPLFFIQPVSTDSIFTFITIGRLVPLKQFDTVIKAFLKEFSGNPAVQLKIIGYGSERVKLERLAGNSSQIQFLGEMSLENVAKEIASANALVSFSKYETFAVPVAEAWACGKPVVVSAQSGIAPYVNQENGIVVSEDAPNQLCHAMTSIHQNYNDYEFENIRTFAAMHFNDVAVMQMLTEIYNKYAGGMPSNE